jgi:hypothetical protein
MNRKYSWSTNEEYYSGDFATREEAIQDSNVEPGCVVYTGLNVYHQPYVDVDSFIEQLKCSADDEAGEFSESWLERVEKENEEKLQKELQGVLDKWLNDTNNEPAFWHVEEVQEHVVKELIK